MLLSIGQHKAPRGLTSSRDTNDSLQIWCIMWFLIELYKQSKTLAGIKGAHREQVALVNDLALAHLQLRAQLAQLGLVLAQQRALVRVLVHVRRVAHALGAVRKLQRAHRLCTGSIPLRPLLFQYLNQTQCAFSI